MRTCTFEQNRCIHVGIKEITVNNNFICCNVYVHNIATFLLVRNSYMSAIIILSMMHSTKCNGT